jgi:ParB family chromosome partitioning protein
MENYKFQEIELTKIARCPWQPRRDFGGKSFEELVSSIREKGVLQPILVRPLPKAVKVKDKSFPNHGRKAVFELMAGERRLRALHQIASENGGIEKALIPAIISDCTDDQAFEIMTIENLQRKDLNELEEARSFKAYLDRKGPEAVGLLSEKTGINDRYIRRRMAVLALPAKCLKAWEKGKLKYGHLEQLMRLADKKEILGYFQDVIEYESTVARLREEIDRQAPLLSWAKFDTTDCAKCARNSDVQKKLFNMEGEKGQCLDAKCFKQKQNNYFTAYWPKHGKRAHGTNGFRFYSWRDGLSYNSFYGWEWAKKRPPACKDCKNFVTLIDIKGAVQRKMACIGDQACFKRNEKPPRKKEKKKSGNGFRVPWHGEHFRQEFYKAELFNRIPAAVEDERLKRAALVSLAQAVHDLRDWIVEMGGSEGDSYYTPLERIWEIIQGIPAENLDACLREASVLVINRNDFSGEGRAAVARYLGIDLSKEWTPNKEYFDRKTKAELHAYAEEFGIYDTREAQVYIYEVLGKKRKAFKSCKKHELVDLLLNCGVDLKGKVPAEVLQADKNPSID